MAGADDSVNRDDPFDLGRFASAQEKVYHRALAELRGSKKRTHWMWYIFPQIEGLGYTPTTKHYAIKSLAEARQYLDHPVLGPRLLECTAAVLSIQGRSVSEIFGYPDNLKLRSSMTLFARVAEPDSVFARVLGKYYDGAHDVRTLRLLEKLRIDGCSERCSQNS